MKSRTKNNTPAQLTGHPLQRYGRVEGAIRARLERGSKALVPFLTAGFPDVQGFIEALRTAAAVGSDVIEVGVPFSDPIADGPSIQYASQFCLERGMTIELALDAINRAAISVPVVLMSYVNPLLSYGCDRLARDVAACGVRGAIVPDLSLDQFSEGASRTNGRAMNGPNQVAAQLTAGGLDLILLSAPTTDAQRLKHIGRETNGFLYAITLTGVTGVRSKVQQGTIAFLRRARKATRRPVLAGFGISSPEIAARIAVYCDGAIVGSALIEILRQGPRRTMARRLERFLQQMRRSLDGGKEV